MAQEGAFFCAIDAGNVLSPTSLRIAKTDKQVVPACSAQALASASPNAFLNVSTKGSAWSAVRLLNGVETHYFA